MKHTKGKWEIHPSTSESRAGLTLITKDGDSVGEVYGSDIEAQKLATLFASAPEMLEMVKEVVQYVEGNGLHFLPRKEACADYFTCTLYYRFAKDILAEAEGK